MGERIRGIRYIDGLGCVWVWGGGSVADPHSMAAPSIHQACRYRHPAMRDMQKTPDKCFRVSKIKLHPCELCALDSRRAPNRNGAVFTRTTRAADAQEQVRCPLSYCRNNASFSTMPAFLIRRRSLSPNRRNFPRVRDFAMQGLPGLRRRRYVAHWESMRRISGRGRHLFLLG